MRARSIWALLLLAFCLAALQARPAEAANGYYNGLKLPYPAGEARVVVRVTQHGPGRHAADFGMNYEDVLAMYAGRVVVAAKAHPVFGNYIVIDHLDNYCAIYMHFDKLYVHAGQSLQQGEKLGRSGNTGQSTGPHLHAAVFRKTNGMCGAANGSTEVMMLFDEKPRGELKAGDWIVSRNGRPVAPYYPSIDSVTDRSINVRWNDYSNNERGFKVERRAGTGTWAQIASLDENSIHYVEDGLNPASPYCYRVRSFNEMGDSTYSNVVCAQTMRATAISVPSPVEAGPPPSAPITFASDDDANAAFHPFVFPDAIAVSADSAPAQSGGPMINVWGNMLGWLLNIGIPASSP
jgi:hypothetical protein